MAEREYEYGPQTPQLERLVGTLAEVYDERRSEVMRILNDSALDRIRSATARTFSDAFVIGKNGGKKDG